MPSIDERYVSDDYSSANEDWHEGRADFKADQVAHMIRKHQMSPKAICDIGCGTAGVLDKLRDHLGGETKMVGYEMSPRAVKLIPADRRQRINVVEGSHDSDNQTFDLLLCLDVVEHLEDYYGFLRGIQMKAPLAIFHIPMDTAITSVLRPGPILRASKQVGHIQHFSRTTALEALRHTGYEIVDAFHTIPARDQTPTTTRQRVGRTARLVGSRFNVDLSARLMTGFPLLVLARTESA